VPRFDQRTVAVPIRQRALGSRGLQRPDETFTQADDRPHAGVGRTDRFRGVAAASAAASSVEPSFAEDADRSSLRT
jgi:hypothetical protein